MTAVLAQPASATACLLCHTAGPALSDAEPQDGAWRCTVCHQMWSPKRLATAAAYADYCVQRTASAASIPAGQRAPTLMQPTVGGA